MRKRIMLWVILGVLIIILGYSYYYNNYSNKGIFNNVINRNGYILNQIQEPVEVKMFIKPEWIPFNSDKNIEINEKLLEMHDTNIILSTVCNRGHDIYFTFKTTYNMNNRKGEILCNGSLYEDGAFSYNSKTNGILLYDKELNQFEKAQHGRGPGGEFSFGIEAEDFEYIREGFLVEYTEYILYEYMKK